MRMLVEFRYHAVAAFNDSMDAGIAELDEKKRVEPKRDLSS
jgi:hypothetical protein